MNSLIRFPLSIQNARWQIIQSSIDAAASPGRLTLYAGDIPDAGGTLPANAVELVSYELKKPCARITNGILMFHLPDEEMVIADGIASWARFADGANNPVLDLDVGDMNSSAGVRLPQVNLFAGGIVRPVLAKLT